MAHTASQFFVHTVLLELGQAQTTQYDNTMARHAPQFCYTALPEIGHAQSAQHDNTQIRVA